MAENLGPDVPPSLYYAMGVQYTENFGRDEQPYLYNGKEFVEVHGLNEYDSQARMYYATIMRTTTMDPHAENRYHISLYAWCSNNPINRIDLDGLDDEFDKEGRYLRHKDNGTDFVMVQNANGEFQNITEFSYCEEDLANRAMLSNVMTYYGKQVGLDQTLDVCDVEHEGAIAATDIDSDYRQVYIAVTNGNISLEANTSNNIMNSLEHERVHVKKGVRGAMAEVDAIQMQITHLTWDNTTPEFKVGIVGYLVYNANMAIKNKEISPNLLNIQLIPTFAILKPSYPILFFNNEFILGFPDIEIVDHKK